MTIHQHLLVPIDGSQTSRQGLDKAIKLASLSRGRLRRLHVVDELSLVTGALAYAAPLGDWIETLRDAGRKLLEEAGAQVKAAGLEVGTQLADNVGATVTDMVLEQVGRLI